MRKAAFILLSIYVFTLPWDFILQFGDPVGSVGRVTGLLALASCISLVCATGNIRRLRAFHIATAAYLGVVTLSLFWSADPENTVQAIRTYLQSIMVVWLIWELAAKRVALLNLAVAYLAGAYVGAISVLHTFSTSILRPNAKEFRFTPDGWNSNDIALALALAIPFALYFAARRTNWVKTWLARGYLIVGVLAIILTSSRAGLTVTAIATSALPLYFRRQTAAAKLLMVVVVFCAGCIAWRYVPQQSWDRLSTIYSSLAAGDLDSRELIWASGLRTFSGNFLIGVGAGAFLSAVEAGFTAHNTFLAILVEQGLLGFTLFTAILGGAIYSISLLTGDERRMCFFMLLCWAVGVFTLGWPMNRITWFVLGFVGSFGYSDRRDLEALESKVSYVVSPLAVGQA